MSREFSIGTERVDDVPLLLTQIRAMGIAELVDEHFSTNGNWKGVSLGTLLEVWLAFILSESNHRLSHLRAWAEARLTLLESCVGAPVRALDFTDDRLATLLDYISLTPAWNRFEAALGRRLIRAYDLTPKRTHIDSTTASGYGEIADGGLFQLGHSKDHRPDLGQVKINIAILDPLGLPLSTTIVSGQCADDPLYVPEIKRIQETLARSGITHVGDSKMAALATRAYVASSGDFYLCPLPSVQMPEAEMVRVLEPIWDGTQPVTEIVRDAEPIAVGYEYRVEMSAQGPKQETVRWSERRLVIRSLQSAESQQQALETRLAKALEELGKLSEQRQGKQRLREETQAREAVERIVAKHRVQGLIGVTYTTEITTESVRRYGARAAGIREERTVKLSVAVNSGALERAKDRMGWRVYVTNQPLEQMSLEQAVLAYRAEYLVERGFARMKGKPLSLTPMYLNSDERVVGLIRVLSIGLRVVTLLEYTARKRLGEERASLSGIYKGNPKRATQRPTAEMMLSAFEGVTMTLLTQDGSTRAHVTPLNEVQQRILALFGFSPDLYSRLAQHFSEPPLNLSEP